ncbi:putative histidine kinase-like ATPase domain-containing protein [Heracleum sosnowskyi]|uniref:Histidine kinase-like ATPase domain-containing protein n=1 Tax=Heracleum sosnowskyi TaxID=360622 RepID=A0AAD8GQJ9_9APIA|nr:putative histidine kinase-like ATPase domain-containing protein [Heracleum sosnowskyi]
MRRHPARYEVEYGISPRFSTSTGNNSCYVNEGSAQVAKSSPCQLPSPWAAPICRQFWKAGNSGNEHSAKTTIKNGNSQMHIHPEFLHSNATSHKWVFGAIAELLDNAVDEIQNGATFVVIDKTTNPRDGSPALLIQDDGGGMHPESIRHCMSFGFSDKKKKNVIGQYGNGFKTSSMRLGSDVIVFTRHSSARFDICSRILNVSRHFDDIGQHGTKIVIYNLWLNDREDMELDFDSDAEDIRINADAKLIQTGLNPKPIQDQHITNLYRYSLRVSFYILWNY